MSSHVPACVVQLAGLKLPPLAKTCFSELIEDQGFNDSHIIDVPSSGKRKKMPKKKSQDALADAAGDSPSSLNGKKLVNQESEEKDSDQLVIWRWDRHLPIPRQFVLWVCLQESSPRDSLQRVWAGPHPGGVGHVPGPVHQEPGGLPGAGHLSSGPAPHSVPVPGQQNH